jgi:hypothetical protein
VRPAREFFVESPADLNLYLLDDRVFSRKAVAAGFQIHAAVDVPTCHDGMAGCFSADAEKLARAQERERARGGAGLLGADGRPAAR